MTWPEWLLAAAVGYLLLAHRWNGKRLNGLLDLAMHAHRRIDAIEDGFKESRDETFEPMPPSARVVFLRTVAREREGDIKVECACPDCERAERERWN